MPTLSVQIRVSAIGNQESVSANKALRVLPVNVNPVQIVVIIKEDACPRGFWQICKNLAI